MEDEGLIDSMGVGRLLFPSCQHSGLNTVLQEFQQIRAILTL